MKILFVNNQWQLGGAETVVRQLTRGLERADHQYRLYLAFGKTYPQDDRVVPMYPRLLSRLSHSRVHGLIERAFPRARWTDRRFRRLAREPGDLIHVHNFHGDYASVQSLAQLASRRPVVWTFHALWGITGGCDHPRRCRRYQHACGECPQTGEWPVGPVDHTAAELEAKAKHLANAPLHVVAPSRYVADKIANSRVGRRWSIHPIPNGVDVAQFGFARKQAAAFRAELGIAPDRLTVLVVNRNFKDPQKGFVMVQRALAAAGGKSIQVILAGQNSDWAGAQMALETPPLTLGYIASRERLAQYFEAADIFLFASPAETFPCVVLEAMAAKCCVVTTPTGGVVEQIADRETGLLAAEPSGESLEQALQTALLHPDLRIACGSAARQKVEREFSQERMVSRYLGLYAELTGTTKNP